MMVESQTDGSARVGQSVGVQEAWTFIPIQRTHTSRAYTNVFRYHALGVCMNIGLCLTPWSR